MKSNKILLISFLSLLILAFQNCSKNQEMAFSSEPSSKSQNEDSGQSYDGKIYVTLGPACSDLTEIHSRVIVYKTGRAEKNRQNCQDMTPIQLSSADYQVDASDSTKLTLNGEVFTLVAPNNQGITNFMATSDPDKFNYSFTYVGAPQFLRIFIDVDNSQTTGYNLNGLGIDFMIENGNVLKFAGAGATDWAFTVIGSSNMVNSAPNVQWSIPRTLIGKPLNFKNVGNISSLFSFTEAVVLPNPTLTDPVGSGDSLNYFFTYNYNYTYGSPTYLQLFIDSDMNLATGFNAMGAGADYLIQEGALYRFTGSSSTTWGWTYVKDVKMEKTSSSVLWTLPRADIGAPKTLKFTGQIWVTELAKMLSPAVTQSF